MGTYIGAFEYTGMKLWGDHHDAKQPDGEDRCKPALAKTGEVKRIIETDPVLAQTCESYWGG
jgi:hypothetical protein